MKIITDTAVALVGYAPDTRTDKISIIPITMDANTAVSTIWWIEIHSLLKVFVKALKVRVWNPFVGDLKRRLISKQFMLKISANSSPGPQCILTP